MRDAVAADNMPFEGGPPHKLETWLGLIRAGHPLFVRLALLAVGVGWLPLVLLTALSGNLIRSTAQNAFILDFGAHTRFLITPPLLILAEAICAPRLAAIARQFLYADLVAEADRSRYEYAVRSTRQLMNSTTAEVATIAFAYGLIAALFITQQPIEGPLWHTTVPGGPVALSPAGWWALLVSLPILLTLLLGWLWRIGLWARFLWLMSQIDLKLIPSHPDRAGGLRFLATSLKGFLPLGFALGVMSVGPALNQVVHLHVSPLQFKQVALGVPIFVIVLCVGPLFVFTRRLMSEQHRGIFQYGALAGRMGQQLERKWISTGERLGSDALEVQDFSATTDLNSIAANVYLMSLVPLDMKLLVLLVVVTALPFVPLVLLAVPLDVIFRDIAQILM